MILFIIVSLNYLDENNCQHDFTMIELNKLQYYEI